MMQSIKKLQETGTAKVCQFMNDATFFLNCGNELPPNFPKGIFHGKVPDSTRDTVKNVLCNATTNVLGLLGCNPR